MDIALRDLFVFLFSLGTKACLVSMVIVLLPMLLFLLRSNRRSLPMILIVFAFIFVGLSVLVLVVRWH